MGFWLLVPGVGMGAGADLESGDGSLLPGVRYALANTNPHYVVEGE